MTRLALALAVLAAPAAAQHVGECDWKARADAIVEPWEENSRTFAGGDIRVALLDTIEPGAVPYHLLVLSPPYDELGGRQCRVVSFAEGIGFAALHFDRIEAGYDPKTGLTLGLPGRLYDPEADFGNALYLTLTVNQSTGAIDARIELGND